MAVAIPTLPEDVLRAARVLPGSVADTLGRLRTFAKSFAPSFHRQEQSAHAQEYLEGLLSDLHRKSVEPIATAHDQPRRPLQRFVGAGKWSDSCVREEFHRRVRDQIGDPHGVLILDGSGFPKKGSHSVGVARQWCGRLGKEDNCQVGVYVGYCGRGSSVLLDADLYLPHEWTRSRDRLDAAHVPDEIGFRTKIEIANQLLNVVAPRLPHEWIVGDDEFGRPVWFRRALRRRGETYLLEVPGNTVVRDLEAIPPRHPPGRRGPARQVPFTSVESWRKIQPAAAWTRVHVRDGEKGPIDVEVITCRVRAKQNRKTGQRELLMVTRTLDPQPEIRSYLSNTDANTPRDLLARVAASRHRVEECFELGKDDLGMDHYEVRSWVGWHHHMTMSLLAQWFLTLEQRRLGEKNTSAHRLDDGAAPSEAVA